MTTRSVFSGNPVLLLAAAVAAAAGCSGTDVTVNSTGEGATAFVAAPPVPPVEVDREGLHEPPTRTPAPITPIYPIRTPPPTPTPRPR